MNKKIIINQNTPIKQGISTLNENIQKTLIVTDDNNKLVGTVTDGDIRRYILKNGDMNESILNLMFKTPSYLTENEIAKAKSTMLQKKITAIPILNQQKQVVNVIFLDEIKEQTQQINPPVVIMAGGEGTRLLPYTKIIPKPLIPIGDKSIIERVINNFNKFGCDDFYLTVNYKKNMIISFFDDLEKEYKVNYVEENKPLGTGGSLHLLNGKINETFFVSNCDILVDADYSDILDFHKKNNNIITVVTSLKDFTIPYGVIKLSDNGDIIDTVEKPTYHHLVNTGMYVLEPSVLQDIPKDEFYHITYLIEKYIELGKKVGTYPVTGNAWLDMGELNEMDNMIKRLGLL